MTHLLLALFLAGVSAVLIRSIKKSLSDRVHARRLRQSFVTISQNLIARRDFPEEHARQLVMLSAIRTGWITRIVIFIVLRRAFLGGTRPTAGVPKLQAVPANLRAQYVEALLSLLLSDSYYSLFMGAMWRAANSWVFGALESIKPDVDAHATQMVIKQTWVAPNWAPHLKSDFPELCHV